MKGFFKKNVRDRERLTSIILKMDRVMNVDDDFSTYYRRAEDIEECLRTFRNIRRSHRSVRFDYDDVLNTELYRYQRGHVPSICGLTGETLLTPFTELARACNIIVLSDGTKLPYPDDLKVGNRATGQAWLADGTEVFSPRHALAHSIQSTAQMLRSWAISFQERMMES